MKMLKRAWQWLEKANGIIVIIYTALVLFSHAFLIRVHDTDTQIFQAFFAVLFISAFLCPQLLRYAGKKELYRAAASKPELRRWFILPFTVTLLFLLFLFIGYYPGGVSGDTNNQLKQFMSHHYSDWHPVFQTLFSITVPLKLTGSWSGAPVLFHIILFSLVTAYAVYSIRIYTSPRFAALTLLFWLINPGTAGINLVIGLKDATFSAAVLLSLTCALHVYSTDGSWLKKPLHLILTIGALAFTTLVRHNAILFTAPLTVALLPCTARVGTGRKKLRVLIVSGFLISVLVIKLSIPWIFAVEKPGSRVMETMGLPMNIIASVAKYDPEAMDEETRAFTEYIATRDEWEQLYVYGDYNSLKWHSKTDSEAAEHLGRGKILSMALRCMRASPRVALTSMIRLTDPVYTLTDDFYEVTLGSREPIVIYNEIGITMTGSPLIRNIYHTVSEFMLLVFPLFVNSNGAMLLLLLIGVLSKKGNKCFIDIKKALLVLPLFIYALGTMLLLTGRGDCYRYYYCTYLSVPPLLAIVFSAPEKR